MVCQICGKKSGYYPLCNEHFKMRDKGLVAKCEECKKWYLVSDGCSRCNKASDEEKGEIHFISDDQTGIPFIERDSLASGSIMDESPEITTGQALDTDMDQPVDYLLFPGNNTWLLYPFYEKLRQARTREGGVRILYYGDSQIEGDRITAYLRKKFQSRFGGSGPGLISPRMVVSYTQSVIISGSANWRRYTLRDLRDSIIISNKLGVLLNYCSFTAPYETSSDEELHAATVKIAASRMGYDNSEVYRVCRILADHILAPLYVQVRTAGRVIQDTIPVQESLAIIQYPLHSQEDQLELQFRSQTSPRIFAISLDDTMGLAIDNIPLRGSQGTDFSRTDTALLGNMVRSLNVGMIILHFGVNVAMNEVDNYNYYERALARELTLLKELCEVPIMVIGISDMYVDGGQRELPNLEKIRTAQINAARKANAIYFDLYKAMGGQGSMKAWVNSDPPLARSDHIHFSREGADSVAQQIYDAIMNNYSAFAKKNE